jgi:hypothetical protein
MVQRRRMMGVLIGSCKVDCRNKVKLSAALKEIHEGRFLNECELIIKSYDFTDMKVISPTGFFVVLLAN